MYIEALKIMMKSEFKDRKYFRRYSNLKFFVLSKTIYFKLNFCIKNVIYLLFFKPVEKQLEGRATFAPLVVADYIRSLRT